ncbi:MAG TPA: sugar phosphate isomerase/epimerase [Steroidobacteraceae bacterium]|nr:sugar phosphate isomerase/epimerase [Steroidobacteraceae bacterium]
MSETTRRAFLREAGRCSLAMLAAQAAPGVLRATPLGGPVGIQLYAVRDTLRAEPAATLKALRAIGYGEVEAAGFAGLSVRRFRALLDEAGLGCPSAHLAFDPDNLGAAFDDAHALGARYAASGSLRALVQRDLPEAAAADSGMSLEEARHTAALANHIGERAARVGLQYVYHNHDFEFADQGGGAIGYDLLLKETDPRLVKFEIDCGWMTLGGRDPRKYFARYPRRFPMIHVKDFLRSAAGPRGPGAPAAAGAELGHGMIDYRPILAAAEKAGLKHYFAEQEGPFTRMTELEAARQAYQYLSRLP